MHHLQHIAELAPLLESLEVCHVIISPGSRNAPLIQLFTSHRAFICHSIVDERVAGYVALGMSRQLNRPVAVVTTSGTAVMNLAPSVVEAYYQHIPLIVLTADRPLETIPQFDNQAIDQVAPFFNHSRGFFDFPPELRSKQEMMQSLSAVEQLFRAALKSPRGPVHVNIPLMEPLYESLPDPLCTKMDYRIEPASSDDKPSLPGSLSGNSRVMVLAGMGVYDMEIRSILEKFSLSGEVVIVAENIANIQLDNFIANPELILSSLSVEEKRKLAPDLVVAFGGQVVSKQLKLFIQSLKGVKTIVLDGDPLPSLKEMAGTLNQGGADRINRYLQLWKEIESRSLNKAIKFLGRAPFSNLTSASSILTSVPEGAVVHLGNSTAIRYAQLMPVRKDLTYFANRGTSGIDGCVSTAVGAALVSDKLHVLLVGDLSFIYDSNSLWNRDFPNNLKVVILNDGGGGIFRLLEGPDRMDFFEEFSVTHHPVSLELLVQSFGRSYRQVSSKKELTGTLVNLFEPETALSILAVDTSHSENSRIFKEFFK